MQANVCEWRIQQTQRGSAHSQKFFALSASAGVLEPHLGVLGKFQQKVAMWELA